MSAAPPELLTQHAVQQIATAAVESGEVPGIVAQVWHRGALCCDVAVGLRDVERHLPMERDAIFAIASMTKPVTVALALTLVDAGSLRLDDPISRWAPEFAQMRVLRRPNAPLDDVVPAVRPITVQDLMMHRAGFTYGFMSLPPLGSALIARLGMGLDSALTPDAWLQSLADLPLVHQPGERFHYGHSIDVLGFIAARAANRSVRDAMRERLFAPLDMPDTDFWIAPAKRARAARPSFSAQPGEFTPTHIAALSSDTPSAYTSGGQGLLSTARDYLRFARMLLNDGELDGTRVLKRETVQLMRTNRYSDDERRHPWLMGQPFTQGFGLGVSVVTDSTQPGATGGVGAFGWPGAFGGWWQADPQADLILLWLQQCSPAPPQPGDRMPRIPGMQAVGQFRQAVYESIRR